MLEPVDLGLYLDPSRDAMDAILDFSRSLHGALGDAAGRVRWFHPSVVTATLLTFERIDVSHGPWLRDRLDDVAASRDGWEVTYRGVFLSPSGDDAWWLLSLGVELDRGALDRLLEVVADQRPGLSERVRREPELRLPLALMACDASSGGGLSADPERVVGQEFTSDLALAVVVTRPGGERSLKRLASVPFARR